VVVYSYLANWAGQPSTDRIDPAARLAFVGHGCVVCEERNDRLDIAAGSKVEVPTDNVVDIFRQLTAARWFHSCAMLAPLAS
jgi:hypothetical protein